MDRYYWAAIHLTEGLGAAGIRNLVDKVPSGQALWHMQEDELKSKKLFSKGVMESFIELRRKVSVEKLKAEMEKYNVKICKWKDKDYPFRLANIFNPPGIFYYKGTLPSTEKCLGIVGSRNCTPYGKQIAIDFARELAGHGFTIVSGAARGIDTASHIGAIKAGKTIAVLGCGLDKVYPPGHEKLYEQIIQEGALISEYPLGTKPLRGNFPARNRIISGLSQGIIVVEAALRSGSLITAELALSDGRDVFAIPGNIYSPYSKGCHHLIQSGAKLVATVEDIVDEYIQLDNVFNNEMKCENTAEQLSLCTVELSPEEENIYQILDMSIPLSTDEIIFKLRNEVSNISFVLLQMKLRGIITEVSPNLYIRAIGSALNE